MLVATLFLLALGFGAAVLLSIASKVFYVYEDPKLIELEDALLGANCGGCGYPGCSSAAEAVLAGKEGADICVAGGMTIAAKVAEVMGLEIEVKEPQKACTSCTYGTDRAAVRFTYKGVQDCGAAMLYGQGPKVCTVGCMGLGSCARACPFGALSMGSEGLPVVDQARCRACGICVEICPKGIMALTSVSDRMIGDYRYNECSTPCQRSCPTGIDIPAYIREISEGNHLEAVRIIKEKNPLPLICGRICPAPCENDCRRNLVDAAVAINPLKRFAADFEMRSGARVHPYRNPDTDRRVAVIGGGAQGLTTSYYLACLGHQPTILEATPRLGGIIRRVIAGTRLPDRVVDWEIEGVLDAGVHAETNKVVGRDYTLNSLLDEGYDAVALATGGVDSRQVLRGSTASDRTVPGVRLLLDFLVSDQEGRAADVGKRVFIVGAGSSTLAAALACKSRGAEEVTIVYPYPSEELLERRLDITEARSSGVRFIFSTVVSGLRGEGEDLAAVTLQSDEGAVDEHPADTLIVSTGRLSDLVFARPASEDPEQPGEGWATIAAGRVHPDGGDDLFRLDEGGMPNDNVAVVRSIGRGRRIARAVHIHLKGKELVGQEDMLGGRDPVEDIDEIHGVEPSNRNIMPVSEDLAGVAVTEFFEDGEAETGFSEAVAGDEAGRCLQCGLICYRNTENQRTDSLSSAAG